MKYGVSGKSTYIVRLEKGEELLKTLKEFCKKEGIENATFTGLGSLESPTLAHYLVTTKKYTEKKVEGVFELLSITGNVALFENEPLIHAHVVLSDEDMNSRGGHLVSATVSATTEIHLNKLDSAFTKSLDDEIGLKLFDLPNTLN